MNTKKIILTLDRVYIKGNPNNEMLYEGENVILEMEQKQKLIDLIFNSEEKWSSLLSQKESLQKDIEIALLVLEPFEVNIGMIQWFARGKDEEDQNNSHLWSVNISIKAPPEMVRRFEDPLLKDPAFIKIVGPNDEEAIQFDSEFIELDAAKNLLKKLEPEFEFEYKEDLNAINEQREERIRKIIQWDDEDMDFYKNMLTGLFPGTAIEKIKEIRDFAATIDGNLDAKMKATKEKFPEQF